MADDNSINNLVVPLVGAYVAVKVIDSITGTRAPKRKASKNGLFGNLSSKKTPKFKSIFS